MGRFLKYFDPRRWEREKRITFFINICVGFAMALVMIYLSRLQYMEKLLNPAIDKMIQWESAALVRQWWECTDAQRGKACGLDRNRLFDKVVFVDINQEIYTRWGEPPIIPRGKISHFLRVAEENKARVVVLDILLEDPSCSPQEDGELRNVLEDMTRRKSSLKIVFPVTLRKSNGTVKRNIFEDIIEANPNFQRGLPVLLSSKSDKVNRYMQYYEIAKTSGENEHIVWSVPILACALYNDALGQLKEKEPRIMNDRKSNKVNRYSIELQNKGLIDVADRGLFSNRIRFALVPPNTLYGGIDESKGNLFSRTIVANNLDAMKEMLRDKIVIIGTSSEDKEGWYPTPIGEMAGFYIIGNAINMLVSNWQMKDAPIWATIILQFLFIVVVSYMFVYFQAKTVRRGVALFAMAVLAPVAYYFYSTYGIFTNFMFIFVNCVFPMLAMNWKSTTKDIKTDAETLWTYCGKVKAWVIRLWSKRRSG